MAGWEAGIMNEHTPIMDTLPANVVSSRKIRKSNSSSDGDHDSDVEDITFHFPPWGPGGLSRECVLRIPMRVVKGD